jgi:hypothetical protein
MAHSGRERHRDRDPGRRFTADEPVDLARAFRINDAERQLIAKYLRAIDEARQKLERQHNAENRDIVRALRASADEIFELLNELEEL